jgi:hypothetical protein
MRELWKSRKFRVVAIDAVVTILIAAVGTFLSEPYPQVADFAKVVIFALQGVFVVDIGGIALEDAAQKRAGNHHIQTR